MRLTIVDIVFFISIGLVLFVVLWLLKGSPSLVSALVSVAIFFATSEFMLWRKYFEMDKNMTVSFSKMRNDIGNINSRLDSIDNRLGSIEGTLERFK